MPSENEQRKAKGVVSVFDPLSLDRAVIAIPLLSQLKEERRVEEAAISEAKALLRANTRSLVAVLELNPNYPGGTQAARDAAVSIFGMPELKLALPEKEKALAERFIYLRAPLDFAQRILDENFAAMRDSESPILFAWPFYPKIYSLVIDLNLEFPTGREGAEKTVKDMIRVLTQNQGSTGLSRSKSNPGSQYIYARLTRRQIEDLVREDSADPSRVRRAIFRIWPDFPVQKFITRSAAVIKVDAARTSFSASGEGITWAVMDTGINRNHPHFLRHKNFEGIPDHFHRDFTDATPSEMPFDDGDGHGTHVAGIIAGEPPERTEPYVAVSRFYDENGDRDFKRDDLVNGIRGMAPKCKLVSLRVLDSKGNGQVSNLIAAIQHVQAINGYGRRILIHGLNISLGYTFEPEWFACGQSPICVEVDRLVKSGVSVVIAAGNTGYGSVKTEFLGVRPAGLDVTINDPGNAELAITVGATHREMPHKYGVSYFSSKGPTGDGRPKPDLVAPGEKIISCAQGKLMEEGAGGAHCDYVETSGTSMAAPHVSGAIAAFLSVRREFIGHPERVKSLFLSTATDLRRDKYFQGAGLLDLMRAIQSV